MGDTSEAEVRAAAERAMALHEKASPPPWHAQGWNAFTNGYVYGPKPLDGPPTPAGLMKCHPPASFAWEDAAFVAEARQLLPRLAEAWLAANPADAGESVTEEWLREAGFYRPQQVAAGTLMATAAAVTNDKVTSLPVLGVEFPLHRRISETPVWRVWVYGYPRDQNYCPTRGEVRALLAALGLG